ncbi:hypothetical protein Tco_0133031 [Tanacetum coccineum]
MILFNSKQRQDFISIKDFEELNSDMLYHVQEIFFGFHQGPELDDLARNFSSFFVAKVDKRNLNPLNVFQEVVCSLTPDLNLGYLYILIGGDCWVSLVPFILLVDLNIKYPKLSLVEDSSAPALHALRRSRSIFTSVYVAVQKLKIRP